MTVLFVDLDNFKFVNDSLGHNAGDELLKTIAKRMVHCIRATDTVVRLGGDEFVIVLLINPRARKPISEIVQKIQAAIAEPVRLEGHDLRVTSSMGSPTIPTTAIDVDTLLANADAAMYRAKEVGRDNFQFYTPELNTKVHGKFLLQEELRNARRPIRVRPPLSAASRFALGARLRGRGADSVEPSEAGHGPADEIHSAG